jgi:hypothetical protein
MTSKTVSNKPKASQKPSKSAEFALREQLKIEHHKRVQLCEALLFCAGVDDGELDGRHDFLKGVCRVAADDLDTLSSALAGSGGENPRTQDFVARLADRLRYTYAIEAQIRELLNEVRALRRSVPARMLPA